MHFTRFSSTVSSFLFLSLVALCASTLNQSPYQVRGRCTATFTVLMKLTSKPSSVTSKIFNEKLVAVHKIKETLTLNRLAYVGMCILDLSKTSMYDFYYNYIKKKYNDKAKLLFTDTDSLTNEIETEDVYKAFWSDGVLRINWIIVDIQKIPHTSINQTKSDWKVQR